MSRFPGLPGPRPLVRTERLIAVGAVALTVAAFAQPSVLTLAGLAFERPASHGIDPTPTGTALRPANPPQDAIVHGLAGTLKALRSRE